MSGAENTIVRALDFYGGAFIDPVRAARLVLDALAENGWHLVSSPTVERIDDPPIPDIEVGLMRYGANPQRITTIRAYVDNALVSASGTLSRELTYHAPPGYREHADAQLGRDFLSLMGHRLGVPGCEDVPERLKRGRL